MTPLFIYYLKATVALSLFYAFYRLLFDKDTFFEWKRLVLISSILLSVIYPFIDISALMTINEPVRETIIYYTTVLPEFSFQIEEHSWWEIYNLSSAIWMIYLTVVVALSIRLSVHLASIFRLVYKGGTTKIKGEKVVLLNGNTAPFSFFRWIFVNPETHSESDLDEILAHEKTHVREWHSLDVIVGELACIAFWFNPFVWLTKKAIRQNLEFLADKRVIVSGYDCRDYQYHLLRLTHQSAAAKLVNNFNVSELKKRIIMMNKKKSSSLGLTKYALLIPLISVLLITNQAEVLAKKVEKLEPVKNLANAVEKTTLQLTDKVNNVIESVTSSDKPTPAPTSTTADVFTVVEQMPQYPGGESQMMSYIARNIKYPIYAQENRISGRVIVRFVVNKDGVVENPTIVKGVDPSLDNEAIRVVKSMDKWTPGKQKGENAAVYYTLPINFSLGNNNGVSESNGVQVYGIRNRSTDDRFTETWSDNVYKLTNGRGSLSIKVNNATGRPLILIDGEEYTGNLSDLPTSDYIMEGTTSSYSDDLEKKYGDKVKNGIVRLSRLNKSSKVLNFSFTQSEKAPLFIIDGKESTQEEMKSINPEKIKEVSVLKDQAATKVYGDKGKNGVVVIKMKAAEAILTDKIIFVDGKLTSLDDFKKLDQHKFAYFGTVDEYNDHGKIYGSKGSKSVVIFTTRKPLPKTGRMSIKQTVGKENVIAMDGKEVTDTNKPLIILDGKEISYEEFKKLNAETIKINSLEMYSNGYVNSMKEKFAGKVTTNTVFIQTN